LKFSIGLFYQLTIYLYSILQNYYKGVFVTLIAFFSEMPYNATSVAIH
jgi:hypothetical protein